MGLELRSGSALIEVKRRRSRRWYGGVVKPLRGYNGLIKKIDSREVRTRDEREQEAEMAGVTRNKKARMRKRGRGEKDKTRAREEKKPGRLACVSAKAVSQSVGCATRRTLSQLAIKSSGKTLPRPRGVCEGPPDDHCEAPGRRLYLHLPAYLLASSASRQRPGC